MINCLIVDDEPLAQEILEGYIRQAKELRLIKKCNTAFEAFEILHDQRIDLLFLDVKMPGLSGIDFIQSLRNPPAVVFTTAFSEYAAASYDLDAVDYLLKPITLERFNKSLNKFLKQKSADVTDQKNYTYFKVSGKLMKVKHNELFYAQSIKDYIILYTKTGNHIVHMTMKYLCEQLPNQDFSRVHRSYLVNMSFITIVGKNKISLNEIEIPLGESYKNEVLRLKGL